MEANTYNKYIPLNITGDITDNDVIQSLSQIGYQISDETIYIAKCRLLNEATYPIETGSDIREPEFDEIKSYLIDSDSQSGLLLGSIKNTDKLHQGLPKNLKGLYSLYDDGFKSQRDVPFFFNLHEMVQYPHIGVFGGSGSGKSYGLRVLIEELMKKDIPTIIFDPHYEMEFDIDSSNPSSGYDFSNKYEIFELGKDIGVDFKELTLGEFKKLLSSRSGLSEPMKASVDLIWDNYKRGAPDFNSFSIFLNELLEAISTDYNLISRAQSAEGEEAKKYQKLTEYQAQYKNKLNESTLRGINWRLDDLNRQGVFSMGTKPLLDSIMTSKTCVIQGNQRLLLVFGSYLINNIYNRRRNYVDHDAEYFPPIVIITDEAHNFAPKGDIPAPTRSIIKEIAQEGRKYGVFLVLATQRPTLLDETVTAQLNSKFIFRTVRGTDIQTIREETDISAEEAKRLPYLKTGDMFASIASMGRTIFSRVRAAESKKPNVINPFEELIQARVINTDKLYEDIKEYLPFKESEITAVLKKLESKEIRYTHKEFVSQLNQLIEAKKINVEEDFLGMKNYTE